MALFVSVNNEKEDNIMHQLKIKNVISYYDRICNYKNAIDEKEGLLYKLKISRSVDTTIPYSLGLTLIDPNIDINILKNTLKDCILTLTIGQTHHYYPLHFLMCLNEPILCEGILYIKLCFDSFFGDIKLICLAFHEVEYSLTNCNNICQHISDFCIITKHILYGSHARRQLATTIHTPNISYPLQIISFLDITTNLDNLSKKTNKFKINIPFDGPCKGFFISCEDINNLNSLKITLKGMDFLDYDKYLIHISCIKLNNNMLYLPFNPSKSYLDISHDSFEGGINISNIEEVTLFLNFNEDINNIRIYGLSLGVYKYYNGMYELTVGNDYFNYLYNNLLC